ncbi:MAG: M48 family metallopeptidase [Synergistaceae bacterium]|jgi:predicted metal-dependent hydrolase|nr:M48 family metallopeptidase [Synergistaceae bacterium]
MPDGVSRPAGVIYCGGRPLSLVIARHGGERVVLAADEIRVNAGPEDYGRYLLYWYTARTEAIVRGMLPVWAKLISVRPRSVAVKYAKTRWGSCSSYGRIFLNSRLAMLTPDAAEYVIVHELCHLKQMNHGPAFWNEVRNALPDASERRRSLRAQENLAVLPGI